MSGLSAPGHAGVRVVRASDPSAEAMRLAVELDADVAVDVGVAERAVRARVDAGRAAVGGAADADEALLARGGDIRAAAAVDPPVSDDDVAELRHLAADLARAVRIRERTERRMQEVLQAKVAASTGVAIHPAAVAAAADAVAVAEEDLATAERDLVALDADPAEPVGTAAADPVLRLPQDDFDEAALEHRRARRRAIAVALVVVAAGVIAIGVGAPLVVAPITAVVAVLLAALLLARGRRAATRVAPAAAAAPPRPASPSADLAGRRLLLEAAREDAKERLRLATSRWHQLAGPDADPHQPEAVVRAHDPQLAYDERAAGASPTVRTVAAFHRRAQARWRVMWASLGRDEAPAPEDLETVLDELLADRRAALAELERLEAAEARVASRAAARRALILVEPQTWVAPGRLAQLLSSVPPDGEVILLEKG